MLSNPGRHRFPGAGLVQLLLGLTACCGSSAVIAADARGAEAPAAVSAFAGGERDAALLEQLWSVWEVRRSEIVTAQLRFRDYCATPTAQHVVTPDQLTKILASGDLVARPDELRIILPQISDQVVDRDPPWSVSRITMQGNQLRWARPPFDSVVDGDLEFHFDDDNEQIGVYPLGKSRRFVTAPHDLRYVPHIKLERGFFTQVRRASDGVQMQGEGMDAVVDEATGLFTWSRIRRTSGELVREHWERGLVEWPGGVPFPKVSIWADYRDGRVGSVWFRILESAEFNHDLPADAFLMAASEDAKIIDYRGVEKRVYPVRSPVQDVRAVLGPLNNSVASGEPHATGGADRYRWLLAVNAVLLMGAGFYLWNSTRGARARSSIGSAGLKDPAVPSSTHESA